MPLDRISEEIAHFIGLFQLDAEAARMRDGYEAFRAAKAAELSPEDLPTVTIRLNAPYEVKPFEPGLKYLPQAQAPAEPGVVAPMPQGMALHDPSITLSFSDLPGATRATMRADVAEAQPHWVIPPPNSIATVTVQHLRLSDDDFLDFGHGTAFLAPSAFAGVMAGLVGTAEAMSFGLSDLAGPGQMPDMDSLMARLDQAGSLEETAPEGVQVTVLQGADASGIVINGVYSDEMPDVRENLPLALRPEEEEEDAADAGTGGPAGETEADNPFAVDAGHHVLTGGNLAANEAYVGSNWVDAEVIAVMGDVVRLDLISQVNVLFDQDIGTQPGAPSWALNAAAIEIQSSDTDGATAGPTATTFPQYWQVERVEGDVVALNWIQQYIFATDYDRVEVEFSGSNTFFGLGGNTLGNLASLVELGFRYDLIIVGGKMITLNMVEQINILFDNDNVQGSLWAADAIDGSGNYLQNSASISTTGVDTITAMTDIFRAAGEALAAGSSSIPAALAADPLFAGQTTLSVLYITGDLIELNAIEQHNYMGDADQVQLALQEIMAAAEGEVTVTTGSNALVNDASINDMGIDSTILAGGEVYSDALIHQAELIDTEAAPEGVALAPLSNEAVAAFLASDMIDPSAGAGDPGGGAPPVLSDSGSLDVMQSVLT